MKPDQAEFIDSGSRSRNSASHITSNVAPASTVPRVREGSKSVWSVGLNTGEKETHRERVRNAGAALV